MCVLYVGTGRDPATTKIGYGETDAERWRNSVFIWRRICSYFLVMDEGDLFFGSECNPLF